MKKPLLCLRHLQSLLARQSQQMGNNGERLKAWCKQTALQSLPVNGVGNRGPQALAPWEGDGEGKLDGAERIS